VARVVNKRWAGGHERDLPRRDRQSCEYEAYLPDTLLDRSFTFFGPVAADVSEAEAAIVRLNESAAALQDTEAIARLLIRAESVASSRIEGLEVGGRRLLRAEAIRDLGESTTDVPAEEVLGNVRAMRYAVDELASADSITVEGVLEVHRQLLESTGMKRLGGVIREEQNWIGGSAFNPCSAVFVPPPPEEVEPLLRDLAGFCNDQSLPAVAHAAIAHAQFETIHPFADGNGRTGRALIHVILRRRGIAPRILPPVSLMLATWAADYVDALTGTRYVGGADSEAAIEGVNRWVELFAAASRRAVVDASTFEERIAEIQAGWRRRLGKVRKGSAVDLLIGALPGAPIVTVNGGAKLIDRSFPQTNEAIQRLVGANVLAQISVGKRNRAFEAPEVLVAFTDLERRLASPEGDTRTSPPTRPVPYRSTVTRSGDTVAQAPEIGGGGMLE
jgi:Fic family protein